jgi:hypothetical protein
MRSFMPCSRYTEADIRKTINVLEAALHPPVPAVMRIQTFVYKTAFITESELRSAILRIPDGRLKAQEFRYYLDKRIPIVITNLNRKLQLSWSPSHLIRDHGADVCSLEDCEEKEKPAMKSLKTFLQQFMNAADEVEAAQDPLPVAIWKIKACLSFIDRWRYPEV